MIETLICLNVPGRLFLSPKFSQRTSFLCFHEGQELDWKRHLKHWYIRQGDAQGAICLLLFYVWSWVRRSQI